MKKALLAFSLIGLAAGAHAQSSVTLYGTLDAGIEYVSGIPKTNGNGSTSRWRVESGNWGTSVFGLKGSEDLGGGTSAVFQLEAQIDPTSGAVGNGTSFFNRWATVGVANDSFGTFLLGRELAISNGLWDFDPLGQGNWSSASLVRGRNWLQSSNNVSYQSPKYLGFDAYGQYSLSNATNWNGNGTTDQGRLDGLQLTYTSTLFQVRGIYDERRDPANGKLDDVFQYSREYFTGLNVFLGQFKLQAAYQTSHASDVAAGAPSVTQTEWAGVTWQATQNAALIAAAYHVNADNGAGNATLYAIGGSYNISKRTLFDFQVATVRNSKTGTYSLEANLPGNPDNPLAGHSQSGVYAGILHNF
jgi:predicted porin